MLPINIESFSSYLSPPKGFKFDKGFATSYSLHLDVLLTVPMFLDGRLNEKYAVIENFAMIVEMIEEYKNKFKFFVQKGEISTSSSANKKASILYELLRDIVIEIEVGKESSFHPKIWLLRYVNHQNEYHYKLIVLSKNITNSSDYDIAVVLDGKKYNNSLHKAINEKIHRFCQSLKNEFFTKKEFENIKWENINGFELENFIVTPKDYPPFFKDKHFKENVIVFSPFVSEEFFNESNILVTREEEISEKLENIENTFKLNESLTDNGGNLHSKIYVYKERKNSYLCIGSSNATNRGLFKNTEFNVLLKTKKTFYEEIKNYILNDKNLIFLKVDKKTIEENIEKNREKKEIYKLLDDVKKEILNLEFKVIYKKFKNKYKLCLDIELPDLKDIKIKISPVSVEKLKSDNYCWEVKLQEITGWFKVILNKKGYKKEFLIEDKNFKTPDKVKTEIIKTAQDNSKEFFEANIRVLLKESKMYLYEFEREMEKEKHEECYKDIIDEGIVDLMIDKYATDKKTYKRVYEMLCKNKEYEEIIKCLPKI